MDSSKSYLFELSIDGSDTKHAAAGDIVTVLLTLKRTDKDEGYTMYAMQDEICYDPAFFELVQGSAMSAAAIETTDISLRGGLRAFYMNFVSFGGGEDWDASTMIGTFQLKVIGTSGSSVIRNTEMQVAVCSVAERILSGEAHKTPSEKACRFCPVADCCDCAVRAKG